MTAAQPQRPNELPGKQMPANEAVFQPEVQPETPPS